MQQICGIIYSITERGTTMAVELDTILFYAFRYAAGRCTYAVSDVCQALIENMYKLHDLTKKQIIQEIEDKKDNGQLGMAMDEDEWLRVSNILQQNLKDPMSIN